MNTTTDKVQTRDSTTGTSTSTSYTYSNRPYNAEQGWECPRCGRINAPWVRQCDCSRNNIYDKWDITWCKDNYTKPWWYDYKVTCNGTSAQAQIDSETFKIHPDSTVYQVGGSDYKEGDTYVNVSKTQSNKVDPNVTAYNCTNPNNCHTPHYTTETVVNDDIHNFYSLKASKE